MYLCRVCIVWSLGHTQVMPSYYFWCCHWPVPSFVWPRYHLGFGLDIWQWSLMFLPGSAIQASFSGLGSALAYDTWSVSSLAFTFDAWSLQVSILAFNTWSFLVYILTFNTCSWLCFAFILDTWPLLGCSWRHTVWRVIASDLASTYWCVIVAGFHLDIWHLIVAGSALTFQKWLVQVRPWRFACDHGWFSIRHRCWFARDIQHVMWL